MQTSRSILIISILIFSASHAQSQIFNHTSLLNLQKLNQIKAEPELDNRLNQLNTEDGLVIGYPDTNEIMTITGNYYLDGDLTIVNQGVLIIDSADFKIDGDIFIIGEGQLDVQNSSFTIIQEYIYQHDATVIQSGRIRFSNVQFQSSGQSWNNVFADCAHYLMDNCHISDGFITTVLVGNATGNIQNSYLPGEYLCFEHSTLTINNCDLFLMWLVLPDSSIVQASLPNDMLITSWSFSDTSENVSGIPYSASIDSSSEVMWGIISVSGSEAHFHDTEFRTVGIMFETPDSIVVENVVNESYYANETLAIPDRTLHFENSEVHTWNFYPSANSNVTFNNCIFGEVLSQDSSTVRINNSICDGTGGYMGAFHQSFTLITSSLIKAQVISKQNAVLVGAESAFLGPEIDADGSSVMFIANTKTSVEPEAHTSAIIFEGQCPPVHGLINDLVPIQGTARLLKGPDNPIEFLGYDIAYTSDFENPDWQHINGFQNKAVFNDTLLIWNTHGLNIGNYGLQLSLHHSFGEPVSMISPARLDQNTMITFKTPETPEKFQLFQNYPNPFNESTKIQYYLPAPSNVVLKIFDIQAREIKSVVIDRQSEGLHRITLEVGDMPSGIYFYQLKADDKFSAIKKFILVR